MTVTTGAEAVYVDLTPVERVWLAVLQDAIRLHQGGDAMASPSDQAQATAWLESGDEKLFSFRWTCDVLKLDPDRVLRQLGQAPQRPRLHIVRNRRKKPLSEAA